MAHGSEGPSPALGPRGDGTLELLQPSCDREGRPREGRPPEDDTRTEDGPAGEGRAAPATHAGITWLRAKNAEPWGSDLGGLGGTWHLWGPTHLILVRAGPAHPPVHAPQVPAV